MTRILALRGTALLAAGPAPAAESGGDAAKGEAEFRKCRACHSIVGGDGEVIFRGGRNGPNLWGVAGRQAGSLADFNYSPDMVRAGEAGLVWSEAEFRRYTQDPRGYLGDYLGDDGAKSYMTFRLKSGAEDIWAYLVSVGPDAAGE